MAMVNISLDTNSRQVSLNVDGQAFPMAEVGLHYFFDMDGEKVINFHYSVEIANEQGLIEKRVFFLPEPENDDVLDRNGLSSRIESNDKAFVKDIHKFLAKD